MALHFGFWVASVKQTSIVTTVVLVTMQPLFVALVAGYLLGEHTHRDTWLGIALAAAGAAVMVSADAGSGSDTLLGDLYAVLGAVFASGYILTGRSLLASGLGWRPYVTRAYTVAAVLLSPRRCSPARPSPATRRAPTSSSCSWRWCRSWSATPRSTARWATCPPPP